MIADQLTKIISGDSHLECDSKWWIDRVPAKYCDRAPRVIHLPDGGGDAWLVEGVKIKTSEANTSRVLYGSRSRATWRPFGMHYDDTPGNWSG